ncbi:MAG: patatin-like phospholipase family protein [Nanoarchaeota archaeon]|nr:patatin-like phospholipase family protein [Nanoarchaeota archaeon]MBU1623289.1 patatin-like phospholipase family protein [Nanoarchaeota archaeon]
MFFKLHLAKSIYSNHKLKQTVEKLTYRKTFADCKIPLYINATYLKNGKEKFFQHGSLVDAIMASCAIIPLLPPYEIKGIKYVDGGLSDFIGTDQAKKLNCQQTIIINLGYHGEARRYEKGLFHLSEHIIKFLAYQSTQKEIELVKDTHLVLIEAKKIEHIHLTDFSYTNLLIKKGIKAGQAALKKIKM